MTLPRFQPKTIQKQSINGPIPKAPPAPATPADKEEAAPPKKSWNEMSRLAMVHQAMMEELGLSDLKGGSK